VVEGGPADAAGLRSEDLIVTVDGAPIAGVDDLHKLMVSDAIGRMVRLAVVREGRRLELDLVPAELEG
jgi:S1-C subfamily serine protease